MTFEIKKLKSLIEENKNLQVKLSYLQNSQYELEYKLNQIYNAKSYKIWQKFNDLKKTLKDPSHFYDFLPVELKVKIKNIIRQIRSKKNNIELEKYKIYLDNNLSFLKKKNFTIKEKISIIIPTKNAGNLFEITIKKIITQKNIDNLEIIIIDSGSTDNTLDICKKYNLKIYKISPDKFSHSGTRNLGAKYATGKYLVFTVQDAFLLNENTLFEAISFMKNNGCYACSSRQIPRCDADFSASFQIKNYTSTIFPKRKNQIINISLKKFNKLTLPIKRSYCVIDDVFAIYDKNLFIKMKGYNEKYRYGEDLEMCQRLISKNYKIASLYSNGVIHSHNRPISYQFKRSYVERQLFSNVFQEKNIFCNNKNKLLDIVLNNYYFLGKQIEDDIISFSNIPESIRNLFSKKEKLNYKFHCNQFILDIAQKTNIKIKDNQPKQNTDDFYNIIKQNYLDSIGKSSISLKNIDIFNLFDNILSTYFGGGLAIYYLSQTKINQKLKLMDLFLKEGI